MKDLSSIDFKDNVRFVVRRYLKTLGIKVPKQKSGKIQVSMFDDRISNFSFMKIMPALVVECKLSSRCFDFI